RTLPSFPTRRSSDLGRSQSRGKSAVPGRGGRGSAGVVGVGTHADGKLDISEMPRAQLADLIQQLNDQMMGAARELQFEVAARLRDRKSTRLNSSHLV